MRTTLELDDDVLAMARELARQERTSLGQVVSHLARQSLNARAPARVRNGVQIFDPCPSDERPCLELVNKLRDGE
ncbi:MAG: hypothetical protein IT161_10425 [Bryobacterales bacterium]|nr:hypothetical protein [Bryobacterales bacterium]